MPAMEFSATYSSPTNASFSTTCSIPAPPSSSSVADKSAYLESLRAAVTTVQAQINKELTDRMEEDKARDASANPSAAKGVDEAKEEENYGEEVQEEED